MTEYPDVDAPRTPPVCSNAYIKHENVNLPIGHTSRSFVAVDHSCSLLRFQSLGEDQIVLDLPG